MIHYIAVAVEVGGVNPDVVVERIHSALDRTDYAQSVRVLYIPNLDVDLQTLYRSTQDSTEAIECAAALANYTQELMKVFGVAEPTDIDEDGETNLDRFNLSS